MYFSIFISAIGFIVFFIWYLASESAASRRASGLGAIAASLLTCGLALWPIHGHVPITLGLDLQGGTEFLVEVHGNPNQQAIEQASAVLRKRLDILGGREIIIQPEGANRIKIQIPGLSGNDVAVSRGVISQVAKLDFHLVPDNDREILSRYQANNNKLPYDLAGDYSVLPMVEKNLKGEDVHSFQVVNREVALSGKHVTRAFRSIKDMGESIVVMDFDADGKRIFGEITTEHTGHRFAIVLDNVVRSAPNIREPIRDGEATISGGNMTAIECDELASVLQNPLENPVSIESERSVDASLGADSIKAGFHAGIIALILVISFMVIYYRVSGLIAVLALAVNLVLLFGLLAQFHFTLTLPGIAGIVLTIGMAVDANVLIYERIRDELAAGKPARTAIDIGFERAFSAIFDSNVTTLIPAVVLAYLGTGSLRGFAVTLVLGIVANLFAALVVSRNAFDWILAGTEKPYLGMMQFIKSPKFDFLKLRHAGLILSLCIIIAGAIAVKSQGEALLGVDFKGGDAVTLTFQQPADIGKMREALAAAKFKDVMLQPYSGSNAMLLQTKQDQGNKAAEVLQQNFPQSGFAVGSVDRIGSQVGNEMKQKAITALLAGLIGILIYAALRFEWSYAVAAAVGQLHDVLIALAIMALLGRELTLPLVAAFLTVAGYSINDKIVVFDRIREGARLREKGSFYEVINRSLNLTLARTILTGSTCLLATIALILFGGPVIHDFSLAMFIGIASGIYSSHFISPGLALLLGRHGDSAPRAAATPTKPTGDVYKGKSKAIAGA